MSTQDLANLGVSAVDVSIVEQNVMNQVKQSKENTLNTELNTIQTNIASLKKQIKTIGRTLRNAKERRINLSQKDIKSHLKKQKKLANELQTQIQNKTNIINQIQLINDTIPNISDNNNNSENKNNLPNSESEKRGKKRFHSEMDTNNQWQCTRCTLLNDPSNIRCSICNTIKPRNLPFVSDTHSDGAMPPHKKQKKVTKAPKSHLYKPHTHDCDDGDDNAYKARLKLFHKFKTILHQKRMKNVSIDTDSEKMELKNNSNIPDTFYDNSLGFIDIFTKEKLTSDFVDNHDIKSKNIVSVWLYNHLYKFQKNGLKWLHKCYNQQIGGILGDDMGLGKTIQIISFLESLRSTLNGKGPALIVCPGSVLVQWLRECHKWAPELRVMLLHDSGRHKCSNAEIIQRLYDACLWEMGNGEYRDFCGAVLITTYASLKLNDSLLLPIKWGVIVLDEGHKIRNPNAGVTLVCKQLKCRHRYILSGSPLQNSLMDLWSLFDFIFPGKLATLPVFEEEFVIPIKMGGYTHASALQIEESIATANVLKNIIDPYILRRTKENVKKYFFIPNKSEQVLFCKLSEAQLEEYKRILNSSEMQKIFEKKRSNQNSNFYLDKWDRIEQRKRNKAQSKGYTFKVITMLRKVCNHCDLLLIKGGKSIGEIPNDYGCIARSGKLQVLSVILPKWHRNGHKSLIFCQTKQFLNIVEAFIKSHNYSYERLDGSTAIRNRQNIINKFNDQKSEIFVLLLTTRAGGLGINLCGADRVIVMDPNWNPSTDAQARERCYRIGQTRDVIVYRLVSKGSIEEKVYQRQIYKQFLTDKVLKDPNKQKCFSEKDLKDLFSLDSVSDKDSLCESMKAGNISQKDIVEKGESEEILSLLFSSKGIASAFRHNHCESLEEKERIKIEKIATKSAKKALKALESERRKISENTNNSIAQPTWTGLNGFNHNIINHKNEKLKKFGNHRELIHILRAKMENNKQSRNSDCDMNAPLSSSLLLAQIKARKNNNVSSEGMNLGRKRLSELREKRYEVLVNDLYSFVKNGNHGNGIRSDSLIQHFDHRLKNETEQCIFKVMLQKMCRLVVKPKHGKCWLLKEKYESLSV